MNWLEAPQNEGERLLREGLDQASKRLGDEITHRRVWARVADAVDQPEPRRTGRWVFAALAVGVVATAGIVVVPKMLHPTVATHTKQANPGPTAAPGSVNPGAAAANGSNVAGQVAAQAATNVGMDAIRQVDVPESERAPGHRFGTLQGERARVALGGGATADLDENSSVTWDSQHRPSVEKGSAKFAVPHQPPGWRFSVTAGPYVVTVVGTKFEVRVANRMVGVDVTEGVVEVWRGSRSTRLVAGDSWRGPLYLDETPAQTTTSGSSVAPAAPTAPVSAAAAAAAPSEKPQPVNVPTSPMVAPVTKVAMPANRGLQEAEAALRAGDVYRALDILNRTAQGTGPAAENAAYELGRVTRYNLNKPRLAVTLWDKYRTRFPTGLLRTEADLSIVETLSQMGDVRTALAEADAFVAHHPNSERRFEVQKLAERLRASESGTERR